jgi:hypothetical protein
MCVLSVFLVVSSKRVNPFLEGIKAVLLYSFMLTIFQRRIFFSMFSLMVQ